jgi:hypothetical protein
MTRPEPDPTRVERLVAAAVDGDPTELAEVARRWPVALRPYHRRLIDAEIVWPWVLMRGMDDETGRYLLDLIERGEGPRDALIAMLAGGGSAVGVEALRRWNNQPPDWAPELGCPLGDFPTYGDWEFGPNGELRPLASSIARELVPAESASVSGGSVDGRCPWCDRPLYRMLDASVVDGLPAEVAGPDAGRVVIATCITCGIFTTIFTEYDGVGSCRWAPENQRPDHLTDRGQAWDLPTTNGLVAGSSRPTAFGGDAWSRGGSTLGGAPDWIQDPEYPSCPRCGRTMPFIAMITGDDLWGEVAEGCHYMFLDSTCRLGATVYQQG